MARGVNKVILIGNLGDEPSFRTTNSGTAVVNISMVTNEMKRNLETGQTTELAEWHRVVMWGKLAEIAHQWLHKGSQVYIEGKLRTRSYIDKQNVKRTITEIVADEMQMLGSKNGGSSTSYEQGNINQGFPQSTPVNSNLSNYGNSGTAQPQPLYGGQAQSSTYGTGQISDGGVNQIHSQTYGQGFEQKTPTQQASYQDHFQPQGHLQEPNALATTSPANTVDADIDDPLPF